MLVQLVPLLTLLAGIGSGLMAGLFFAYSNSVMPALARMPTAQAVTAMNHVNVVILNPLFLGVFMGTALLALALIAAAWFGAAPKPYWLIAGALLYLAGNIGVTAIVNVPMNVALAAADANTAEAAALWSDFLGRWLLWNHVRALACAGALAAFVASLL